MTVIERMARAIWDDREQHQNERCRQSWERGSELARQFAMDHARAALTAILKPTPAMNQAALDELSDVTVSSPKSAAWDAMRAYRAMIQSALDERQGS